MEETPSAAVESSSSDWRSNFGPVSRKRIINTIMDTLKKHLRISDPDGLKELLKFVIQYEERTYNASTDQNDYVRKISKKMLSMATKTQGTAAVNPSFPSPAMGNQSPAESAATLGLQPQVSELGQSLAMPFVSQSQVRQQLSQNLQNYTAPALQGSAGLPSELSPIAGLNQSTISSVGQTSSMHNMSGVSENFINNSGQGVTQNMYGNAQRQIQGRQQQPPIMSQQQQQSHNQYLFQKPLQQQLMKQKMQHPSLLQPHMHQQQQESLQPNQLQSSQQPLTQMTSSLQSAQSTILTTQPAVFQLAPQPNLQQNQQPPQSVARQQQGHPTMHQESSSLQQQPIPISQQPVLPSQKPQPLIGQQANMSNMQHPQLLEQQNIVPGLPQQRLSSQQNNLMSMQQTHQMLNQQTISLHQQQQVGPQNNISGLQQQQQQHQQQQLLGSQSTVSSMQPHRRLMHISQQPQQQSQQRSITLLQSQGLQSQHQLMPQIQSQGLQSPQLQQKLAMQQQPNSLKREMQQRIQGSDAMLQSQNTIEQYNQFIQSQRGLQEVSSSSSMEQTGVVGAVDWQEETYQKIKSLKESYFAQLCEVHKKLASKLEEHKSPVKQSDNFEKTKLYKQWLEHVLVILQYSKNNIKPSVKEKLPIYEKKIVQFLAANRSRKIAPSLMQTHQQFQHPGGHALSMLQQQPSEVPQLQQHDNHVNQSQQMNLQGPVVSTQTALASNMQHGSFPLSTHVTVPSTQVNMTSALQPSKLDPVQGSSFGSLQQEAMSPVHQGSDVILHQHLKQQRQEQQQQLMQTQHMKQQMQHRPMLMQPQQKHLLLQQLPVQQQLLQQKQPQPTQMQVQQNYRGGQCHNSYQLKNGASFPISSPQNMQASSPQISQHSSPQIDQQVNVGHQQTALAPLHAQVLSICTPGISPSPFLEDFTSPDGSQANAATTFPIESSTTGHPLDLLVKLVQSLPYKTLCSSVSDIGSVVSMFDRIAGSAPGNGSRAAVGEDLVAMTKCRLQARNFISEDGNATAKKMKRHTSARPLDTVSSAGSVNDSFKQSYGLDIPELESTATSNVKRQKANHALLEEIREINQQLIDTVVGISDEDAAPVAATTVGGEGTVVKFSFNAVSLSSNLKSHFASAQMSPIMPLRMLVPADYPKCSPVLLDELPVEASKKFEDLTAMAKTRFGVSIGCFSKPVSLREMARIWDSCVRKVIAEYAQQSGGGSFSSRYGAWENCVSA